MTFKSPDSLHCLMEAMVLGEIRRLRIESNEIQTKYKVVVDYNQTYTGSSIRQACDNAWSAQITKRAAEISKKKSPVNANFGATFLEKTAQVED